MLSGKKFYAGNKNLKTGTLALSGSAGTGDVLRGATFYKDDPKSKLTGTLALSGNANAAQVLSGYTFYKDNAKSKQTGTMANKGAVSATLNPGGSYNVPAGYHNGSGKVTAKSLKTITVSITKNLWSYTVNGTLVGFSNLSEGAAVVGRIYISGNTVYYENKTGGTVSRTITLVYY